MAPDRVIRLVRQLCAGLAEVPVSRVEYDFHDFERELAVHLGLATPF